MDMKKAKADVKKALEGTDGIVGVGVGDGVIRVYVENDDVKNSLPTTIAGVPVEIINEGIIERLPQ